MLSQDLTLLLDPITFILSDPINLGITPLLTVRVHLPCYVYLNTFER